MPAGKEILKNALKRVIAGQDLNQPLALQVMREVIDPEGEEQRTSEESILVGGLLSALQTRGLNEVVLWSAVTALKEHCRVAETDVDNLVDCCGTGGDAKSTFNISTAAGIIAAAAGARVGKHGNRSVSSRCGSADVLSAAGVDLDRCAQVYPRAIAELGFGFLYAPQHYRILARLAPIRKALGIPTLFNLTGPLLNPSNAKRQVLGVYNRHNQNLLARTVQKLGREKAWIVRAEDGLDEISVFRPTRIVVVENDQLDEFTFDPRDYQINLAESAFSDIVATGPEHGMQLLNKALKEADSPCGLIATVNAAAILCVADVCGQWSDALEKARRVQENGQAVSLFRSYVGMFDADKARVR